MKHVLVTGANGFVGRHLIGELKTNGITVIATGSSESTPDSELERNVSSYYALDLTKASEAQKIDFSDIDGVVHLAGLSAVGPSFDNPMQYIATNIGIEVNLYEQALRQGVRPKFLIVSSGTLYNSKAPLPLTESSEVLPSSPYSVSKLGQEQIAKYYETRGFESIIVRPFNHIGPGQNEGFLVPDLSKQIAAAERNELSVLRVGNLEAKRDYTDVRDITRAYRLLLEKGKSGETYNVCSGTSYSGQDILNILLQKSTTTIGTEKDPERMRPSDAPDVYGSHEKITHDTGWQPSFTLEQTLEDALNDWRNRK